MNDLKRPLMAFHVGVGCSFGPIDRSRLCETARVCIRDRVEDTRSLATWADFERFHLAGFSDRAKGIVARYGS